MLCLKRILLLLLSVLILAYKPGDGPGNCKLSISYNKKDSTTTFKTKTIDWAGLQKKVKHSDTTIYMTLHITNGEMDDSDGIRFIFRDGTSLTKPDVAAKHEMGLSAGGNSISHTSIFELMKEDLKKLKEESVLEYRIGKTAKKVLSEKQALKFREGLDCIINAK